jgi:hypothetical protein
VPPILRPPVEEYESNGLGGEKTLKNKNTRMKAITTIIVNEDAMKRLKEVVPSCSSKEIISQKS